MRYLLLYVLLVLILAGCLDDDVATTKAVIPYPDLNAKSDFRALMAKPVAEIADVDEVVVVFSDILVRLMNVVNIANHMADEVAAGSSPNPRFKSMSRELSIIDATSDLCLNESNETTATSSLIWDDVDNNNEPSIGDQWFNIWKRCFNSSNSAVINGVMAQTGMIDPTASRENAFGKEPFSNWQYTFDLEMEGANNNTAYFENAKFVFSFDGDEIATLKILPGSIMGATSENKTYLFEINSATFISDDDGNTLAVEIDARYFDVDLGGYVDIKTSEKLVFEYAWQNINNIDEIVRPQLTAGVLAMTDENNDELKLAFETDEKIKITFDSDNSILLDQSEDFFQTNDGRFSLPNLTGG